MIQGSVSSGGVPIITLSIGGRAWVVVIDTGFNGDLELPEDLRGSLNSWYVGRITSALAGGQVIEEAVYRVNFPFDGQIVQSEATFVLDGQILVGTHLLRDYRLMVDFVRKMVELERVKTQV